MSLARSFLIGIAILLLQSSKLFKSIGISVVPDMILIYIIMLCIYLDISPLILVVLSIFFGLSMDQLSLGNLINTIIFPVIAIIVIFLKDKLLISNIFTKTFLILALILLNILFKHILVYIYTKQFSFSISDVYYTFNSFAIFYIFYLARDYIYERKS